MRSDYDPQDKKRRSIALRVKRGGYGLIYGTLSPILFRKRLESARECLGRTVEPLELTLERLNQEPLSLTRFGEGELTLVTRPDRDLYFQRGSDALRKDLHDVLSSKEPSLHVCLPPFLGAKPFWREYWARNWPAVHKIVDPTMVHGNSMITRPEVFRHLGERAVELWRGILSGKSLVIVTGRHSRFHLEPALFGPSPRVRMLEAPSANAYEESANIRRELRSMRADMVIFALGPAGTVLSAQMAELGRRSLDLGHLSNSHSTVFSDQPEPELQ